VVKVLDFGLAKMRDVESSELETLSNSPTLRTLASTPGMILGTAAYMSPEQAKGRPVDRRTDIFAFGCVLYEMLTGRRAFEGEDMSDTLAAVLRAEPDWNAFSKEVPSAIRTLLKSCLEKDRRKRLRDISAALREAAGSIWRRREAGRSRTALVENKFFPWRYSVRRWLGF
jgi:serine/threonine protein kinase